MRLPAKVSTAIALFFCLPFSGRARADRTDLVWSTFLGGSDYDLGYGVAVDDYGHTYVTGVATSPDFPTKAGVFDTTHGGRDIFVVKFSTAADTIVYSTLLGGSDDDEGKDVCVDHLGAVYLTGVTVSADFPVTAGAFSAVHSGLRDVVVAKLDPSGGGLEYATFLGGSGSDWGKSLAVDGTGNAYVTGYTNSEDFPATFGAYDTTYNGGQWDVFVAQLNSQGSALVCATFLGGGAMDDGLGLALDDSGHAIVTGRTDSPDFPTTTGAYDPTHNGGYDAFVSKVDLSSGDLVYSSFLGGSEADYGYDIASDGAGNTCLTGKTSSADFPTTPGAYGASCCRGLGTDAFVAKFNSAGNVLEYSALLSGSAGDEGHSITVDTFGRAYVTGCTWSMDFPVTAGAYSSEHSGYYSDAFVVKLSPDASALEYGTFLGGGAVDFGWSIFLTDAGHIYVTGETKSSDFPTTAGAYQRAITGNYADVFVAKLDVSSTPVEFADHPAGVPGGHVLYQNCPNPFNASTEIHYRIPKDDHISLKIFNTLGQEVRNLVTGHQVAGEHSMIWDARDEDGQEVTSGVYFCRLQAGDLVKYIKMVLLR
jgi:hypothetical protein